jgi:iron-sulfur cluster assembly protein
MSDLVQKQNLQLAVTEAAQNFMRRMVRLSGQGARGGFWLRVEPGGCSGLSATFEVRGEPGAADTVVELPNLRLFVAESGARHLEGVTVDFSDTRTESGLVFVDPKAEDCACASGKTGVQLGML